MYEDAFRALWQLEVISKCLAREVTVCPIVCPQGREKGATVFIAVNGKNESTKDI